MYGLSQAPPLNTSWLYLSLDEINGRLGDRQRDIEVMRAPLGWLTARHALGIVAALRSGGLPEFGQCHDQPRVAATLDGVTQGHAVAWLQWVCVIVLHRRQVQAQGSGVGDEEGHRHARLPSRA